MLYVRTVSEDLTARARIRDRAIECFASEGFGASVRTIAASADVSPGLITHHFGSKETLRAECDVEVLRRFKAIKTDSVLESTDQLMFKLADSEQNAPLLVYILRSIQSGGDAGREFVEHVIDDARDYMAAGVAAGILKPSRDEEARLRYLTYQTLGAMLMQFAMAPGQDLADFASVVRRVRDEAILPTLELFTEGLLASSDMLDSYLTFRDTFDADSAPAAPSATPSPNHSDD